MPDPVRIVLDEDVPSDLAEHLIARGLAATSIAALRESVFAGNLIVTDEDVCREIARIPSVLVTLNIRDYADPAFIERLVEEFGVSVVIVRPPKAEAGATKRPQAIRDIVHRHAHRMAGLYGDEPRVASANRGSMRVRGLTAIRGEAEKRRKRT